MRSVIDSRGRKENRKGKYNLALERTASGWPAICGAPMMLAANLMSRQAGLPKILSRTCPYWGAPPYGAPGGERTCRSTLSSEKYRERAT